MERERWIDRDQSDRWKHSKRERERERERPLTHRKASKRERERD